ncbi:Cas8a1 family CRISPR/Cas system-associated protein [Streptosporangium sp. NPDC051022]|uniref:Cas8a1 family CRISPR/Cas system-associated protein n=1 Tax=Streptosporangium sp. NPDC051022 TaxID=3155752 RepID=UPI00343C416D
MTGTSDLEQARLMLTAHPLQRVGAYAVAAMASDLEPDELPAEDFERAVKTMTRDAIRAALVRDSKTAEGFWLKASYSITPNSPMNHPSNGKKPDDVIKAGIQEWRNASGDGANPDADCVLCGRPAVGFFGKVDVPLAESNAYRNSTPRGHEGMALCRPCVVSFHALPYGSHLTGGASYALHSWDAGFMRRSVQRQVDRNLIIAETGKLTEGYAAVREVVALRALRGYGERLTAGVELLVFNNNNRGQSLEIHSLDQPLAEWLRRTLRPVNRQGFAFLVRAHVTAYTPGIVMLARNAFGEPTRLFSTAVRHLGRVVSLTDHDREQVASASRLLDYFVIEVMQMNEKDLAEIRASAHKVAALLSKQETGGKLNSLRASMRESRKMRAWLTKHSLEWAIQPPENADGPLVSERAFVLLFGPGQDNPAWFHRDVFLFGVLEKLSQLGWRSKKAEEDLEEIENTTDVSFVNEEEEQ